MKKINYLTALATSVLLFGCAQVNKPKKSNPLHLSEINKIVYYNKGYWLQGLKNDMNSFKSFEKKTFASINAYKRNYAIRYGKKIKQEKIIQKQSSKEPWSIVNEQY